MKQKEICCPFKPFQIDKKWKSGLKMVYLSISRGLIACCCLTHRWLALESVFLETMKRSGFHRGTTSSVRFFHLPVQQRGRRRLRNSHFLSIWTGERWAAGHGPGDAASVCHFRDVNRQRWNDTTSEEAPQWLAWAVTPCHRHWFWPLYKTCEHSALLKLESTTPGLLIYRLPKAKRFFFNNVSLSLKINITRNTYITGNEKFYKLKPSIQWQTHVALQGQKW